MKSNKIAPMANGSNGERFVENVLTLLPDRNQNSQTLPLSLAPEQSELALEQSNSNRIIAGSTALFCAVIAFGITVLCFSADQSLSNMRNETSFGQELGQDGKYGIAFAVSASIYLGVYFGTKRFLDKEDDRRHNIQNPVEIRGDLVFGDVRNDVNESPNSSFRRVGNSLTNSIPNQNHLR